MEISKHCLLLYIPLLYIEDCGTEEEEEEEEEEEPITDIESEEAGRVHYHSYHLVVS